MEFEYKNGRQVTDTVNLITTILFCYPEVTTVNFNPTYRTLTFGFWLSNKILELNINSLKQQLLDSIEVFNLLENRKPSVINFNHKCVDDYTILEIERDLETLMQSEISLTVLSLQQLVKNNIIIEKIYDGQVDEQIHEEIIDSMLFKVKNLMGDPPLLAFREEGRVLVFNM